MNEFQVSDYKRALEKSMDMQREYDRSNIKLEFMRDKVSNQEADIEKEIGKIFDVSLDDYYSPSDSIKTTLQVLINNLPREEYLQVMTAINGDIKNANYFEKSREISASVKEIERLANKIAANDGKKLTGRDTFVSQQYGTNRTKMTFKGAVDGMADAQKKSLDFDRGIIEMEQNVVEDHITSQRLIDMAQSDYLEANGENRRFQKNVGEIVKQVEIRENATKVIKLCEELLRDVQVEEREKGVSLAKVKESVTKILAAKRQELATANRFLSQYNIDNFIEMSKEYEKVHDASDTKDRVVTRYKNIVQEIDRIKRTQPVDYQRLEELRNELEEIRNQCANLDIKYDEFKQISDDAVAELHRQEMLDDMFEKEQQEEKEIIKAANAAYSESVREEAIRELEADGTFDGIYQEVSGDVRDVNPNNKNREKIIQEKMREIMQRHKTSEDEYTMRKIEENENKLREIAEGILMDEGNYTEDLEIIDARVADMVAQAFMTPEERYRYVESKDGTPEKDIPEPSPSQLEGYRDGMSGYQYTGEIKNIVKEMGEYRASLGPDYLEKAEEQGLSR